MATQAPSPFSGTLKLATYPNRFNTVVPAEGPFYRTGLKLTSTGTNPRPLTEGLDYYLCYYFKEAAETLKDQVFGGIMLLTETEVNYTIYSVGREYRVPQSEIGKFLVSQDLKDPRNIDWSELMRYAPVVAPIDPPANLNEAILRDEVVAALDNIRKGIIKRVSDMDASYAEVTDLIFQNGKKIFDDNMYQHHLVKNAHQYTAEEIGALKVLQKAVDSTKAFGKTIDELVDIMKANGISQTHIDTLMPVVLGELRGRMRVLDNGALTFRTADSSHVITLQGDKFLITTTKPLNITADADNNDPGIAVEMTAGYNAMYVASGAQAPIFNGAYLITPDMVSLYLSAVKLQPANAYFQSTDSVKIYGNGKDYAPVNLSTVVDTASETKPGLLLVTSISTNIASGAAISQAAVTALKTTLDNYVDQTYTVNGKGFVVNAGKQELTLTATDIGLGNINNTAPRQKPLTTAIINALKNKALATHTHTAADLTGVPTASDTVAGLVQLWDAIDATTNKVVTSKQGYNVQQRITALKNTVNQLLPAWTAGGSAFGNPGYLPIPAVGNYGGFAKQLNRMGMGTVKQEGNVVYALRNGNDGLPGTDRIFYSYAQVNPNGSTASRQQTSMPYHPAGMSKYPGVVLQAITAPGEDAIVCLGSDGAYYTVLLEGTLNYKKHTRVFRSVFPTGMDVDGTATNYTADPTRQTAVVYKNAVYIIHFELNNAKFHTYMLRADTSSDTMTYAPVDLSGGVGKGGIVVKLRENVNWTSTDPATQGASYVTAEGLARWGTRNIAHNLPIYAVAQRNNILRLGSNQTLLLLDSDTTFGRHNWITSFTVNMDTGVVTLENPEIFPIKIDVDGAYLATGERVDLTGQKLKFPYGAADNRARPQPGIAGRAWNFYDQSIDTYSNGLVHCSFTGEFYDYIEAHDKSGYVQLDNWQFNGGIGSVYDVGQSHPVYLGNNAYLFSPTNNNSAIYVEVDPSTTYSADYIGAGPTNNRRSFPIANYYQLADMTWCAKGSLQSGKLNGAYWTGPGAKNYQAIGETPTADTLTISQTEWNKIVAAIKSQAPTGEPYNGLNSDGTVIFSVWAIRPMDANPIWLVQASFYWLNGTSKRLGNYIFQIYPTVSNGNVTFVNTTADYVYGNVATVSNLVSISNTAAYGGHSQRMGQPIFYEKGDGTGLMFLPNFMLRVVVGSSASYHFEAIFSLQNGKVTATKGGVYGSTYYANPNTLAVVGELLLRSSIYSVSPSYFAGPSITPAEFIAVNQTNYTPTGAIAIIAGVKTAEGWNFYITEDIAWRIGPTYYTAPAYNVDLKTAFPGNYQNRVFHVHVVLNDTKPEYQLLPAALTDTDTRLYLGTITTDSNRIVGTDLKKVKRMGGLKQLVEHAGNVYEHDLDVPVDLKQSPLGLLKKEPLGNNISLSTYFDSSKSDLMVVGQKRSERRPTIKLIPTVFDPSDPLNRAADFYPAPTAVLATSSENSAAAAAGRSWIGTLLPTSSATHNYAARPLITPTKNQIRVKVYLPSAPQGTSTQITVNGQAQMVPHAGTLTFTLAVTPGKRIAVEIAGAVNSTNRSVLASRWMAFAIYDWDGTTETQLAASDSTTPLIYSMQGNTMANMVLSAEAVELGVAAADYLAIVTAGGCNYAPPVIIQGTTAIVATRWTSHSGLEQAADLAINLMPKL